MLNKNEKRVLKIIERDPFISQKDIADELKLTRSTVATIISGLNQKKRLLGRAYVVNKATDIYCIGAMTVDRTFNLLDEMIERTSNPATSTVHPGGVARNIAENLGRKALDVSLITMGGYDQDYQYIKNETEPYVNMQHSVRMSGFTTGTYNALLDHNGEMKIAVSDMNINEEMTVEWLKNYESILKEARLLVVDLNLPLESVEYVISIAREFDIEIFVVPASVPKINRLPKDLTGVDWIIVAQDASEKYFDLKIETEEDFQMLSDRWLKTGVQNVIITRESACSIYANQSGEVESFLPVKPDLVVDTNGSGNRFISDIIYGIIRGQSAMEAIQKSLKRTARPNIE